MGYRLGVDLGTTFTAAAVARDGRAAMASIGDRGPAVPSVIWLDDEQLLTGTAALRRAASDPSHVAREFKRRVGDPAPLLLGGAPYSAEQLSAKLLRWVFEQVAQVEGEEPELTAVCHPANWGPYKKELLAQAIRIAEIGTAITLTEPEAAAIHYASAERMETDDIVAVYDLGGGTFDAAVLRKTDTGFEMLGEPEGIERLGGVDFDAAVFGWCVDHLDGALDDVPEDDPDWLAAITRLRDECTLAKEALSSDTETTIEAWLPTGRREVRLTREEFEKMLRPPLRESVKSLRRALETAGITPPEVSTVLLVGGSSRIPLVGQLVATELGRPVAVDAHPKHAIALGAAMHAAAHGAEQVETARTQVFEEHVTRIKPDEEATEARVAAVQAQLDERAALLEETTALAMESGRSDLAVRLADRAGKGDRQGVRVLVVGDYKAGKSSLVNALVGEIVCPVDADQATIVPTVVRYSSEPVAIVYVQREGAEQPEANHVDMSVIASHITSTLWEEGGIVRSCEIGIASDLLREGITIVDLPGAGGLDSTFGAQAIAELATADAVIFVSSAAQELTRPELDLLKVAVETVPRVMYALTKVDYYPEWRRIRELDTGHLINGNIDVNIQPVSSVLVELARQLDDQSFLAESGMNDLMDLLREQAEGVRASAAMALAGDLQSALGQVKSVALAEQESLDPERAEQVLAELESALEQAEDLRLESAEWHRVLRDGIEDLRRLSNEELERMIREILAEADSVISESDPAQSWEELQSWLQRRASWMVTAMFEVIGSTAAGLKKQVAARLAESETDLLDDQEGRASPWIGALKLEAFAPDLSDPGAGMSALTSGWSVTEPAVALGSIVPFMSGIGLVVGAIGAITFGRKALKQRKARQIAVRREHAHSQCKTYLEDASHLITRETDKAITHLYRHMRDHAFERAEELERSLGDGVTAARRQMARADSEREQHATEIQARLDRVDALLGRVRSLATREPIGV